MLLLDFPTEVVVNQTRDVTIWFANSSESCFEWKPLSVGDPYVIVDALTLFSLSLSLSRLRHKIPRNTARCVDNARDIRHADVSEIMMIKVCEIKTPAKGAAICVISAPRDSARFRASV